MRTAYTTKATHVSTPAAAEQDRLTHFLELSQDILSLIRHENAILLERGELSFEAYVMRKMELMGNFEKEARNLLGTLSGSDAKMNTQAILAAEIQRVRDALKVNSGYQLETIRARMREKIAEQLPASEIGSETESKALCH